ncbi:hypothetical protein WJX77_007586 [Trebouxia sp. C0004]
MPESSTYLGELYPDEALVELQREVSILNEIHTVQDMLASMERSSARALHTFLLFAIMMLVIATYISAKN